MRLPKKKPKSWGKLFPDASPLALDLLSKMLTFNQNKRISVEQALCHPYLANLHCPDDEIQGKVVSKIDFEFELYDLTKEQLKDLIYEEILMYHFKERYQNYKTSVQEGKSMIQWVLSNENSNYIDNDCSDSEDI